MNPLSWFMIYMYHFHTSDQRKTSAYISHITLTQNVNEIYSLRQCLYLVCVLVMCMCVSEVNAGI